MSLVHPVDRSQGEETKEEKEEIQAMGYLVAVEGECYGNILCTVGETQEEEAEEGRERGRRNTSPLLFKVGTGQPKPSRAQVSGMCSQSVLMHIRRDSERGGSKMQWEAA